MQVQLIARGLSVYNCFATLQQQFGTLWYSWCQAASIVQHHTMHHTRCRPVIACECLAECPPCKTANNMKQEDLDCARPGPHLLQPFLFPTLILILFLDLFLSHPLRAGPGRVPRRQPALRHRLLLLPDGVGVLLRCRRRRSSGRRDPAAEVGAAAAPPAGICISPGVLPARGRSCCRRRRPATHAQPQAAAGEAEQRQDVRRDHAKGTLLQKAPSAKKGVPAPLTTAMAM